MNTLEKLALLERAAQASGVRYDPEASRPHPVSGAFWGLWLTYDDEPSESARRYWNPLTDDGDNARLRRTHRIVVQWFPVDVAAMHWSVQGRGRSWAEPYGDDKAAAERLAVVRAAAEIGG